MTPRQPLEGFGEAGRSGPGTRADARIQVDLRPDAGIELVFTSSVAPYYGEQSKTELTAALRQLEVRNARIEIDDHGALPFVLLARLEAAVRKAWPQCRGKVLPETPRYSKPHTSRDRHRRSRLYLPGNEAKFALNAGLYGSDAVILDLEDSVAPAVKEEARILVRNTLRVIDFGPAERMVRINQGGAGVTDLEEVIPEFPDLILIPKVEDAATVQRVDARIRRIQDERPVWLMPIIESAAGVLGAREVAGASERVVAIAIGLEDLTADLGVARTKAGTESFVARSLIVLAARAAGVQAIDTVFSDVADEAGLRESVKEAKALGFEGKGCIHPAQIEPVHEEFAPSATAIAKALEIVAAYEKAGAAGLGVVALGSKMIDAPVVKRAQKTVALARSLGLVAEGE